MKKFIFLSVILFLITIPLASAMPTIENFSVQPPSLWLGEGAFISLNCLDENYTIEQVYADIIGPSITLPTMYFTKSGENYSLSVDKEYLDRTGNFDVTISCENNNSEISYTSTNFTISELTGYINKISPSPAYIGDTLEIDFIVKKDDTKLSSGVVFNVTLNDDLKNLKVLPAYDINKGWILKINSPTKSNLYDLEVTAFYDRTSVTDYDTIDVRNKIEFEIVSIDRNWIKTNDNITVRVKALERGSVIELNKNNVDINIGSTTAEITSVSREGDLFNVKIIAPSLSSGRYNLEAYLNYESSSYSDSEPIDYIVTVEGVFVDEKNKAMNVKIIFIQDDITKLSITTDAYGHYSGSLPPDIYDVKIIFPRSEVILYDVSVSSFDDPIKHFYSTGFSVSGIRNAGLYSFEIDLSYFDADIEMKYEERNVISENNLRVFRCSSWSSGRGTCNGEWEEVVGEIDVIRNKVKITSSTLSAFVIGEIKALSADFSLDKERYYLNDDITITGILKDEDRGSVSNATIDVNIKNTGINSKTTTDENGVFSVEIPAPEIEGEYGLVLKAKKHPYKEFSAEKYFEIIKSRSVYIDFPDTIKIARGNNLTQEFSLTNNGQADLSDLKISLEGIPENYYSITSDSTDLKIEEKKTFYIDFFIPVYADTGISSTTLKIEDSNVSEEKIFGLNIFEKIEENETTAAPTGLVTGFVFPEISYLEVLYIVLFAVACFSVTIILKKRKVRKGSRGNIKNFLFDIKNFIEKEEPQTQKIKVQKKSKKNNYDKIIATEFPNFLKLSENLKKIKGGE